MRSPMRWASPVTHVPRSSARRSLGRELSIEQAVQVAFEDPRD
jgi:hypothetical protein